MGKTGMTEEQFHARRPWCALRNRLGTSPRPEWPSRPAVVYSDKPAERVFFLSQGNVDFPVCERKRNGVVQAVVNAAKFPKPLPF
jgi:hypothetical protein